MAALSENSVALEEFESVKDIYQDFKVLSDDPQNPKCSIPLIPSDLDHSKRNRTSFVSLIVTFIFPQSYPSNPPSITFEATKCMKSTLQSFYHTFKENKDLLDLTKRQRAALRSTIDQYLAENKESESEMLFDLINLIQEWVDENNLPPSDDCFDLIPDQTANEEEKQSHDDQITNPMNKSCIKPRLLMLHAYKQNGKILRSRSKQFVKPLLNHFDLSFPDAPMRLNGTPSCPNPFCWYQYPKVIHEEKASSDASTDGADRNLSALLEEYTTCDYIGFFPVIQYFYKFLVDQCAASKLPFVGIIAFSQGATFGTLLMWLATLTDDQFEEFLMIPHLEIVTKSGLYGLYQKYGQVFNKYLKIKACVLMSGHLYPLPKQLESSYCEFVRCCKGDIDHEDGKGKKEWTKLQCPSLHTMSPADKWVKMAKSKDLCDLFQTVKIVEQPNGHVVYNNKYVFDFMRTNILESD